MIPNESQPLEEAYQKFKHLDKNLCDADEQSDFGYFIAGYLWRAIKAARESGSMTSLPLRPVNASECLPPCPKCGSPTFCGNIDGGYTILCLNDACKWKQKIIVEPEITLSAVMGYESGQRNALPTDEELHALKQAVCFAIEMKVHGAETADGYYHKLKDLRGDGP